MSEIIFWCIFGSVILVYSFIGAIAYGLALRYKQSEIWLSYGTGFRRQFWRDLSALPISLGWPIALLILICILIAMVLVRIASRFISRNPWSVVSHAVASFRLKPKIPKAIIVSNEKNTSRSQPYNNDD